MDTIKKVLILSLSALLMACNPLAKLPGLQSNADSAFEQKDFQNSYNIYKQYIELSTKNNVEVSDEIYHKLAISCGELDKLDEASANYYALLKKDENSGLVTEFAQLLNNKGKVQEELALWNKFEVEDQETIILKTERLMALSTAKEDYEAVIYTYANKGAIEVNKEATMQYITALDKTDNTLEAAKACNALVKSHPDYVPALEWKGTYYYDKADSRYKEEMAKYNKNKNATTYAYLLRDLKKVSADFRVARDTFEQLRKLNPDEERYIKYLKNCYLRLEQKAEAAKMDRLLK